MDPSKIFTCRFSNFNSEASKTMLDLMLLFIAIFPIRYSGYKARAL